MKFRDNGEKVVDAGSVKRAVRRDAAGNKSRGLRNRSGAPCLLCVCVKEDCVVALRFQKLTPYMAVRLWFWYLDEKA